jgi:hypothetical protein
MTPDRRAGDQAEELPAFHFDHAQPLQMRTRI